MNNTKLVQAFEAGNYANAYHTEDLDEAMFSELSGRGISGATLIGAFVLGFYSSYEDHEIPEEYREQYWSAQHCAAPLLRELGVAVD